MVLGAPLVESEMSKLMLTKVLELVLDPKCMKKTTAISDIMGLGLTQACLSPELSLISLCVEAVVCSDQSCLLLTAG